MQRGRFAPSPTGELHLGNARTALLAWLWARAESGSFALRVEDIDTPRVREGMAQQQLSELRWLGLDWDGEPVFQSRRTSLYESAIARPQQYDLQALTGDFVLRRADGIFAYQLAVTVDDGVMGITQVLRGADLLSSTPRQILLHRLLGQPAPAWAHVPLVLSADGER